MGNGAILAAALSLCTLVQGCAPRGEPAPESATQQAQRVQPAEDPCAGKTYAQMLESSRGTMNRVLWDYGLDVRKGDTLWGIAQETRGDPLAWTRILDDNLAIGTFKEGFDPRRDLRPGQRILVYLPVGTGACYAKEQPGRRLDYWSHGPGYEQGSGARGPSKEPARPLQHGKR